MDEKEITKPLQVQLTEGERELLERAAEAAGRLSLAAYIRLAVVERARQDLERSR